MLRCGIDLVENKRIDACIRRYGARFLNRIFTPNELADCQNQVARLAARFAAKEACAKVIGTGIGAVSWKDIEVTRNDSGRPQLILHNDAAHISHRLNLTHWDISLSHTDDLATAVVVAFSPPLA